MDDTELAQSQIDKDLAELAELEKKEKEKEEEKEDKDKGNEPQKEPVKKFVALSKEQIAKLSGREKLEYKIKLAKHKTRQLEKDYRKYKSEQTKTDLSAETKKLILLGKFLQSQFARDDRRTQNEVFRNYLDQYLTDNSDRQLLGFPLLHTNVNTADENHAEENHDHN